MTGTQVILQDRTPVKGGETAFQGYLDLTLNKDDLVEAILAEHQIPVQEKIDAVTEELRELSDRENQISIESKKWIEGVLYKSHKKEIETFSTLLKTKGKIDFSKNYAFSVDYYAKAVFSIVLPTTTVTIACNRGSNEKDWPHYEEMEKLSKKRKELARVKQRLQKDFSNITGKSKKVKLELAKQLLSQTDQGKQLTQAMSMQKLSTAIKKNKPVKKVVKKKAGKK